MPPSVNPADCHGELRWLFISTFRISVWDAVGESIALTTSIARHSVLGVLFHQ